MKLTTSIKTLAVALTATGITAHAENFPGVAEQHAGYCYTGKPYDTDLGSYVFNARNYNPEINRWTSADPSGFPDGANNSLYVNNWVFTTVDGQGLDIIHINNTSAVGGAGHSGAFIGNSMTGYTYHSYGQISGSSPAYDTANGRNFSSRADALGFAHEQGYDRMQGWITTEEQDASARSAFNEFAKDGYNVTTHNCLGAVQAALTAAGVDINGTTSFVPNQFYNLNMPPYVQGGPDFSGPIE